MPTIERISLAPYNLRLKAPLRWGAGHAMHALQHVLVRVELSDGAVGLAEVNPRPTIYGETPESVEAVIRNHIAPHIVGMPLDDTNDITAALETFRLLKANNSARAGIDVALWDALAQSQGRTLSALLGVTQERVRVSYILGTGPLDSVLAEAERVYNAGVRVLKVKVGKDFAAEQALLRQLRAAHPDLDCYIDANETLAAADAPAQLAAFAELGAMYCEEPLPVRQLTARADLRTANTIPLIADDSAFTYADLERELAFNTFDILNIKPPRNGFTEARRMMQAAREADKGVMFGSQASSMLGCAYTLLLAATEGAAHPSEGTFWLKVEDTVGLPIVDGYVRVADIENLLHHEMPHSLPYENAYRLLGKTGGLSDTQEIALRLDALPESARNRLGRKNALAQVRAFAGVLIPELDNLLVQVRQSAQALRDDLPPVDRTRLIDHIDEQSRVALRLAKNLRDATYVDMQIPIQPRRTHFDHLVRMTFETFARDRFARRAISHTLTVNEAHTYTVRGQDWMLLTVIGHLLDNAYQATPEGGHIAVMLGVDEDGDIIFTIADNGTGIPTTQQSAIYDKWTRAASQQGYGLGLYITRYFVQAHGGAVWFDSSSDGTTFSLTLPRIQSDDEA